MASVVQNLVYVDGGVTVPKDFERDDFIRVFVDGAEVQDFSIEADGIGGRSLVLGKMAGEVCLVYDPDISFELNKIGGRDVVSSLNGYFARLRGKIELIECRLENALGGDVCGPSGLDLYNSALDRLDALTSKVEACCAAKAAEAQKANVIQINAPDLSDTLDGYSHPLLAGEEVITEYFPRLMLIRDKDEMPCPAQNYNLKRWRAPRLEAVLSARLPSGPSALVHRTTPNLPTPVYLETNA